MIALIRIEIDEKHLAKETNEIYDRLQGYNSVLMPLPKKIEARFDENSYVKESDLFYCFYCFGRNEVIDEITGESNGKSAD